MALKASLYNKGCFLEFFIVKVKAGYSTEDRSRDLFQNCRWGGLKLGALIEDIENVNKKPHT